MIAIDTHVLLHARRRELPHHRKARALLKKLAESPEPWALPWPCVYEFLRIVTHPKIFAPPTELARAIEDLESLLASPSVVLLGEGPAHAGHLSRIALEGRMSGDRIHDAHVAALVAEHGVAELWTTDKDFARFPGIRTRDPFR